MSETAEPNLPDRNRKQLTGILSDLMFVVAQLDEIAHLEKSRERLKVTVARLDGDVQGRTQQLAALDTEIAELKSKAAATSEAEQTLARLNEEIAAAEGRLNSARAQIKNLRERFSTAAA